MKNLLILRKLDKQESINPDRDWFILLTVFLLIAAVVCGWLAVDYFNLWRAGDAESIQIEIAKKTTINQKDLDESVSILDRRADRFDLLYKTAPKVVDPSL